MSRARPSSLFLTFEGGEGAGKSTQIHRLAAHLAANGREIVVTREPGGSLGAERIRHLLLDPDAADFDPITQCLLFAAARRDHMRSTIAPALGRGAIVLCDRFIDSTRAYQGAGGLVPPAVIRRLETLSIGRTRPQLTLILDLPPEVGMERARLRAGAAAQSDRFERQSLDYHARIRAAFRDIAANEPERCALVDATGSADAVFARVRAVVLERCAAWAAP